MKIVTLEVGYLPTNCYILCDDATGKAAVIDPGFESGRVLDALQETGCTAQYLILTHGHFDHATEAWRVLEATGAKLVADAAEEKLLADPLLSLYDSPMCPVSGDFHPLAADIWVSDGDTLPLGSLTLAFLHTPGHTGGCCCIRCGDAVFTGDTIFRRCVGRTDMPTGSTSDILRSARRIAQLPGDYTLYPGHGEKTTLAYERENNFYMS